MARSKRCELTLATGNLLEILRERASRTSLALDLRLIRDSAAGSLRAPGLAITSDQTIHKANAARRKTVEKRSGKISSVGMVEGVESPLPSPPKCSLNYSLERHECGGILENSARPGPEK